MKFVLRCGPTTVTNAHGPSCVQRSCSVQHTWSSTASRSKQVRFSECIFRHSVTIAKILRTSSIESSGTRLVRTSQLMWYKRCCPPDETMRDHPDLHAGRVDCCEKMVVEVRVIARARLRVSFLGPVDVSDIKGSARSRKAEERTTQSLQGKRKGQGRQRWKGRSSEQETRKVVQMCQGWARDVRMSHQGA